MGEEEAKIINAKHWSNASSSCKLSLHNNGIQDDGTSVTNTRESTSTCLVQILKFIKKFRNNRVPSAAGTHDVMSQHRFCACARHTGRLKVEQGSDDSPE